jgi:branched-chain amino acid transport system permease protein
MLTILFDGVAYGMLLFLLASGLAVTLGLMNFVNLAHGRVCDGGRLPDRLCSPTGWAYRSWPAFLSPFYSRLRWARSWSPRSIGVSIADRTWTRCCSPFGLVFMTVAAVDYYFGSTQQFVRIPEFLKQRFEIAGMGIGAYRLFIIVVCGLLALLMQAVLSRTRFGSRLRAAVDDPPVASGLGIDVNRIFLVTFAFGSGLAGLGGALGAEILGLDPTFPLKFMIYFLIVVAVGGTDHDHRATAGFAAARHRRRRRANITFPNSARSSSTAS